MLSWSITFLVVAIIAAFLGYGGIAGQSMEFARILFFLFLVLFLISSLLGWKRPPAAY